VEFAGTADVGTWGRLRDGLTIEVCFHAWPPSGDLAAAIVGIRLQVNCLTNEQHLRRFRDLPDALQNGSPFEDLLPIRLEQGALGLVDSFQRAI
jgi:hypothetical protein